MGEEKGKNVGIDTVIINTHANASILDFGESGSAQMTTDDIKNLDYKFMDQLILYGCNAGHLDHALTNPASAFSSRVGSSVLAADGTVSAGLNEIPLFKNKLFSFINRTAWTYTPEADEHFFNDCIKNGAGNSMRTDNQGWVIYRNGQLPETGRFDSKTTNLNEMITIMNKERFSFKKAG